jgi:hypothetical protein
MSGLYQRYKECDNKAIRGIARWAKGDSEGGLGIYSLIKFKPHKPHPDSLGSIQHRLEDSTGSVIFGAEQGRCRRWKSFCPFLLIEMR